MNTLVPQFGIFSQEENMAVSFVLSKIWKMTPTSMGSVASPEIFENLPFREDIDVPFLVLKAEQLKGLVPDYSKSKDNRPKMQIIVCFSEQSELGEVMSEKNKPDFYIDLLNKQLLIA
jgi:hypothetical protein